MPGQMKKWKVLSSHYVVQNYPYQRIRQDHCLLPNGLEIDAHILEYPNWVNAIVLTPTKEIVLVIQYRHGIGDFVIETPGGMVDDEEHPQTAIIREVAEETGYRSSEPPILLGEFSPNPASSNNKVSTYLFLNAVPVGTQQLDRTEDISVHLIPFDTFGHMIKDGQVPQIFSAMGYYLAKEFLLNG